MKQGFILAWHLAAAIYSAAGRVPARSPVPSPTEIR